MTLEDAIVYYSESAKECRRKARIESNDYMDMKDSVYEAEQLAVWLNELKVLRERINAQPERKKGEWVNRGRIIRCNKCKIGYATVKGMKSALTYNFCPNCGADMRGKKDE